MNTKYLQQRINYDVANKGSEGMRGAVRCGAVHTYKGDVRILVIVAERYERITGPQFAIQIGNLYRKRISLPNVGKSNHVCCSVPVITMSHRNEHMSAQSVKR